MGLRALSALKRHHVSRPQTERISLQNSDIIKRSERDAYSDNRRQGRREDGSYFIDKDGLRHQRREFPPLPRARNKFPVHSNNWTIIASAHHSHSSYLRRQSNRWEISWRAGGGGDEGAIASRRIKPRFRPTTGRVHLTHLKERAEENDKNDQTADCRGREGGREVRGRASEVGLGS